MNRTATLMVAAAVLTFAVLPSASAQPANWPERPVRIVVPFVAGAMGDLVARLVAEGVRAELGQPLVVDNRPGATGNIGARHVEQSLPDGYTLLMAATNNLVINQFLFKNLGFDPLKRFEPVTILVNVPSVIYSAGRVPARSLQEFTAWARTQPGKVNYGSPGSGSTPHLSAEAINRALNLGMQHVPYKGASQAVAALLAGEVQFYLGGAGVGAAHVKEGKLRALAVSNPTRLEVMPEVPTFAEVGLSAVNASNWWAVAAPAGTPKAITARLQSAFCKALGEPDAKARLVQFGNIAICNTPAEMARQLVEEAAYWQKTLPGMGVSMD